MALFSKGRKGLLRAMPEVLVREIVRRNPFRTDAVPWIARVYAYPFERWSGLGKQALFGAPNFLLFYLYQKIGFLKATGRFSYRRSGQWQTVRFDARNTQFSALYMKAFEFGYEPHVAALADAVCSPQSVVYDIGSNWGWLSLLLASRPDFAGQIHAFEPYPPSFRDLKSVVTQTGLASVIQCHHVALSDKAGQVQMRLPDSFQSGQAAIEDVAGAAGDTTATTMDDLKLPPPDFIKIDVEGAEARVLGGGLKTLAQHKPMIIFESGRCDEDAVRTLKPMQLMQELGYQFFHLGWLKHTAGLDYLVGDDTDAAATPKETLALQEFQLNERFLRPGGMNIFACHKDRLPQLEETFSRRSLAG